MYKKYPETLVGAHQSFRGGHRTKGIKHPGDDSFEINWVAITTNPFSGLVYCSGCEMYRKINQTVFMFNAQTKKLFD